MRENSKSGLISTGAFKHQHKELLPDLKMGKNIRKPK